jgi:hypothetical protein
MWGWKYEKWDEIGIFPWDIPLCTKFCAVFSQEIMITSLVRQA